MALHRLLITTVLMALLSGCQSMGALNPFACDRNTPADKKLNYGVLSYEEGNYQASVTALQGVLETGLSSKSEKVQAYKYLAFIQCVSGREAMCKDYFRKALAVDPEFTLEPAEAGHPIWGPAFRSAKGASKNSKF